MSTLATPIQIEHRSRSQQLTISVWSQRAGIGAIGDRTAAGSGGEGRGRVGPDQAALDLTGKASRASGDSLREREAAEAVAAVIPAGRGTRVA